MKIHCIYDNDIYCCRKNYENCGKDCFCYRKDCEKHKDKKSEE